ncbi:hypothetical protein GQR58_023529 [Nymphon striatum]|nr:hypothetical protein GQR58_023529 [Nymphon striatum]
MPGELARDAGLSSEEKIVRVMKNVFDRHQHEMSTHEDAMHRNCADFENFYDTDIDGNKLFIEIGDCRMLLSNRTEALPETPLDLLGFIVFYGDDQNNVKLDLPAEGFDFQPEVDSMTAKVSCESRSISSSSDLENFTVAYLLFKQYSATVNQDKLDLQLKKCWVLESLGIDTEKDSVYNTFKKNVKYDGNKYSVGLP